MAFKSTYISRMYDVLMAEQNDKEKIIQSCNRLLKQYQATLEALGSATGYYRAAFRDSAGRIVSDVLMFGLGDVPPNASLKDNAIGQDLMAIRQALEVGIDLVQQLRIYAEGFEEYIEGE